MTQEFRHRTGHPPPHTEERRSMTPASGSKTGMPSLAPPVFTKLMEEPGMGMLARATRSMEAIVAKEHEVSRMLLRLLAGQTPLGLAEAYRYYFAAMVSAERLRAFRSSRDALLHGHMAATWQGERVRLEPEQLSMERGEDRIIGAALEHNRIVYVAGGRMYSIDRSDLNAHVTVEPAGERGPSRLVIPLDGNFGLIEVVGNDLTFGSLLNRHRAAALTALDLSKILSLKHAAEIDGLTGIHNRRAFDTLLEHFVRVYCTGGPDIALVMFDVDHFKRVNDRYGHGTGDDILAMAAATASATMRATDLLGRIPGTAAGIPNGQTARYGGEEFALLLPGVDPRGATIAAQRCREAIASRRVMGPGNEEVGITVSMGIATASLAEKAVNAGIGPLMVRADGGEVDHVARVMAAVKRIADDALYAAKQGGRNAVVLAEGRNGPEGLEVAHNRI